MEMSSSYIASYLATFLKNNDKNDHRNENMQVVVSQLTEIIYRNS